MASTTSEETPVTDEHLPPVDVCPIHTPRPSILPDTCTCSHPNDADCHPGETR